MRTLVDRERCIGSGTCVLTLPEVFTQDDDDGRVVLITDEPDDSVRAAVERAAVSCPVQAISVPADDSVG